MKAFAASGNKMKIIMDPLIGRPIDGEGSAKLASQIGVITRDVLPVPKKWKDIWNKDINEDEAEKILKAVHPDWSIASWSLRFCLGFEGVIAVLSGMSTLEQMRDNIKTSKDVEAKKNGQLAVSALTDEEQKALAKAMHIYRESAPIKQSEIDKYKGLLYHGVPVTAILQAYSICQIQPDPGFSDDNNYLKNAIAEAEHVDFKQGLTNQSVITADGENITEKVEKAVNWLTEHSF